MDDVSKEYSFLWFIENYSYCWHKHGECLSSPGFVFGGLDGTHWVLMLYPRGYKCEEKGTVSLFLGRYDKDAGPEEFLLNYELSVLASDGSVLHSIGYEFWFQPGKAKGCFQLLRTDEIHLKRKAEFLPNDTLSLRCKMWKGDGDVQFGGRISARTRISIEKISFMHVVENFGDLPLSEKHTIEVQSHSKEGRVILNRVYSLDARSCCGDKIMIEIETSDAQQILYQCKLFLLDKTKNLIECGGMDYMYEDESTNIRKVPLSITRKAVLDKKSEYLPDDKLSLLFEGTFSAGKTETIQEVGHDLPVVVAKAKNDHVQSKGVGSSEDKLSDYPTMAEDMKNIYINRCFTDVVLKTKTKSFTAHRNVLCARSPVFKAMMTSDMKEKNTDCIQIDDMENDTIEQLLLFLYSDNLENLQWESASRLYYAADKYEIGKLKAMCSAFLTENLSVSNASDLLLLADTHTDSSLKKVAEDFILEHEEQVFGSNRWERLIETNPQLVIKTMHLKYRRKNII